jgi:hypothetical protein
VLRPVPANDNRRARPALARGLVLPLLAVLGLLRLKLLLAGI